LSELRAFDKQGLGLPARKIRSPHGSGQDDAPFGGGPIGGGLSELEVFAALPREAKQGWWTLEWWWDQPNTPHVKDWVAAYQKAHPDKTYPSARTWFGYAGLHSTFFNLISGMLPPTGGRVWFDGEDITEQPVAQRVAAGIVRTFQITEIFPALSVFENIRIGVETAARANHRAWLPRAERSALDRRVWELLAIVDLDGKADRIVGELAHGDQRVVEVAMALSLRPRLLLLDEPTAGMGTPRPSTWSG
jgi:ABC-type transport system involved in cytochrome c biogenesis ATPase subunit